MKLLSYCLLLTSLGGCDTFKKSCFRDQFINHEFKEITKIPPDENATCQFTDTNQISYKNGEFLAQSSVVWPSCNEYHLIVRKANYTGGVKVGDTVKVKILSQKADTFFYEASVYGVTLSSALKKIK